MSEEDTIICPFCDQEVADDMCEHTVFLAVNECGLMHLAKPYHEQFMTVAEKLLRKSGELEDGEDMEEGEFFPAHIIPAMMDDLQIDGLEYRCAYGIPPSGLAVYAAFIDAEK